MPFVTPLLLATFVPWAFKFSLAAFSPFPLYLPLDLEKASLPLALMSLQGQLQLTICIGLLYFSSCLSFTFGEVGEVGGVMFNEKKVDSYLFYTVQCLLKKTEEKVRCIMMKL